MAEEVKAESEEEALRRERIFRQIDGWRESLIDRTKRNKLLYFTSSRTASVQIISPGLTDLYRRLVEDEAALSF